MYGQGVQATNPLLTDGTMFDRKNFVFNVIRDECRYIFKNNSNRGIKFRMYVCQSKSNATPDSPVNSWASAITQGIADGTYGSYNNTPAMTVNDLYADPRNAVQFNNWWKCETQDFALDPGETASAVVKSECGVYDMKKFYNADTYQVYNRKGRWVFFVCYNDLVTGPTPYSSIGRLAHSVGGEGLIVETVRDTMFSLPEQIGFTYPASYPGAVNQTLNKRIRKFGYETGAVTTTVASVIRVDPVNPELNTD